MSEHETPAPKRADFPEYAFPESTWLDIGDHDLVLLGEIAAISTINRDVDDYYFVNAPAGVVLTVIHTRGGALHGSLLSWREIRNRLRKCQHTVIT